MKKSTVQRTKSKRKAAKRTEITPQIFDAILERISLGETLSDICRDRGYPDRRSFHRFLLADAAVRGPKYALARTAQAESWSDEIIRIADDSSKDVITEVRDGRTITRVDHDHINRSRLRVDTRKWSMSKLHPKQYGDTIAVDQQTTLQAGDSLALLMQRIRSGQVPQPPKSVTGLSTPAAPAVQLTGGGRLDGPT